MKVVPALHILMLACGIVCCSRESDENNGTNNQNRPGLQDPELVLQGDNVSDATRINGTVFRHLLGIEDGRAPRPNIAIGAYYLRVSDLDVGWRDPDEIVVKYLHGFSKPVKEFSKCRHSPQGVWDLKDGSRGIRFSIDMVLWKSEKEVDVEASISLHAYAAEGYFYRLEKRGDRWIIVKAAQMWIS